VSASQQNLISTQELAKALGVGYRSIKRWVAEGWLRPTLVTRGNHWRWDVDQVRQRMHAVCFREMPAGDVNYLASWERIALAGVELDPVALLNRRQRQQVWSEEQARREATRRRVRSA
jgi:excisionase family DNA binding protein